MASLTPDKASAVLMATLALHSLLRLKPGDIPKKVLLIKFKALDQCCNVTVVNVPRQTSYILRQTT